ncbi:MAG: hypothetical protein QOJ45_472 [Verrucomicrobiota bacterium]|jgi:hypothetical protein
MASKFKLPAYTVYIDTSVAYSRKPSEAISRKLCQWIERSRSHTSVDVRVPDVVVEELAYQQFAIAQAATLNLKKNSQTLKEVCALEIPPLPTETALKESARAVLLKTLDQLSLSRIATPVEQIDWVNVIRDSCWRTPPFEKPQSADDLAEKGFRDKIVLETIKADASTISSGVIAFVSGDSLLRSTFRKDVEAVCQLEDYSGFDGLVGHLDLLAKTKSEEFASAVMAKAASVFYDPNDADCIAISCGVVTHLINQHSEEMAHPSMFSAGMPKYPASPGQPAAHPGFWSATSSTTDWVQEYNRWIPVSPIKLFASMPVFQPAKQDDRYHWISTITLAQLLRRTEPRRGQGYALPEERIRTKDVDVEWSCRIDGSSAEFSDVSVDAYHPTIRDAFLEADWRLRTAYGFPLFPGADAST